MRGRLSQSYPLNLLPVIGSIAAAAAAAISKQHDEAQKHSDKDNQSAEKRSRITSHGPRG